MVKSIKTLETNVMLVDAGNAFGSGVENVRPQAEVMVKGMALMGYDALNLGANESGLGRESLDGLRQQAGFPFLSANLVDRDSQEPVYTPYVVRQAGQLYVGVIGLTELQSGEGKESLQARDPATVLNTLVPQVRQRAHLVVVLAQLPYEQATALLSRVRGIDVMIVASQDNLSPSLTKVNDVLVANVDRRGTAVGKLEIVADVKGRILNYRGESVALDERVSEDATMLGLLSQ